MRLSSRSIACQLLIAASLIPGIAVAQAPNQHNQAVADQLVGAWRLVFVETVRPNGEIIYPIYGKHPQGLLI